MSQRIQQNIKRDLPSQEYSAFMSKHTGEYIDAFTTVKDKLTAEEVLSREPKCCVKYIPLTQGYFAIVDYKNYDKLMKHKWCVLKSPGEYTQYAVRHRKVTDKKGASIIFMHNEILPPPKGMQTDHRNHNGLDNREFNLRHCTHSQNQENQLPWKNTSSKYKGVCWHKYNKKWASRITKNLKVYELGYFDNEIAAAKAYDKKANELFGEFACLNFPKEAKANVGRNKETNQNEANTV